MWLEVLYWIDHVWSFKECVCCVCDPSEHLDAHSICFVCVLYAMHLALWYVMLVCDQYDVCEDSVGSVYIGLSESKLCLLQIVSSQLSCSCLSVLF